MRVGARVSVGMSGSVRLSARVRMTVHVRFLVLVCVCAYLGGEGKGEGGSSVVVGGCGGNVCVV